jgi:hypothetical protein
MAMLIRAMAKMPRVALERSITSDPMKADGLMKVNPKGVRSPDAARKVGGAFLR